MELESLSKDRTPRLVGAAAAALAGVTLLATFSMGSYVIPGRSVVGLQGWPQPIGWIAQILVVESWPTFGTLEIRWVALTAGTCALAILAVAMAGRWSANRATTVLLGSLAGYCAALVGLVLLLAITSPVVELGLMWTWQLAAELAWMLVLYWWAVRLPIGATAKAIGLSLAALAAISLLYSLQGAQRYPNWPVGNVLLLTTACLAGVFLLGLWAYQLFADALRTGHRRDWVGGLVVTATLLLVSIAVSMSGRRAGVLGLLAGGAFIFLLSLVRSRRAKVGVLVLVIVAGVLAAVAVPRLFRSGRWESVVLRAALYSNTADLLAKYPLIGVGPGHLGAYLTSAMRPLHAESPRLFHGEVNEHAHSEPLHALAELGIPVGLLYLVLPLGGLASYVLAYRRLEPEHERLTVLGLGAALTAVMAAEATSVGMRHPGVAALVWALVAIGYACGLRSGAFEAIVRRFDRGPGGQGRFVLGWRIVSVAAPAGLCVLACMSMAGAYHMANGLAAWNRSALTLADAELDRARLPQGADQWMMREYIQGRTNLALARQTTDPREAELRQDKAISRLTALMEISPAFKDTPVWFGRALGDVGRLVGLCQSLCESQEDPYEREALLVLASQASDPADKLKFLRASLRNAVVIVPVAQMIVAAAEEPAGRQILAQWTADADKALPLADPGQWPDPLALETFRLAVIVHGERGQVALAARAADKAAALCTHLQQDVRQRRLEAVELETYLDQAWFGWLNRPQAGRSLQAMLDEQNRKLIYGEAESFSARMTLQFLAMLQLLNDKQSEAVRDLLVSEGSAAQRDTVSRLLGLAYARLVVTFGPPADSQPATTQDAAPQQDGPLAGGEPTARQLAGWTRQGKWLLGEKNWSLALEQSRAHKTDPWWHGVLMPE